MISVQHPPRYGEGLPSGFHSPIALVSVANPLEVNGISCKDMWMRPKAEIPHPGGADNEWLATIRCGNPTREREELG